MNGMCLCLSNFCIRKKIRRNRNGELGAVQSETIWAENLNIGRHQNAAEAEVQKGKGRGRNAFPMQ